CATARYETPLARSPDGTPADQSRRCRARQQDRPHGLGHDGTRRAVQGAEVVADGSINCRQRPGTYIELARADDVMQIGSFRGSGERAWGNASLNACEGLGPDPRTALGPAATSAAQTGRTRDRTRPICSNVRKFLPGRRPHVTLAA